MLLQLLEIEENIDNPVSEDGKYISEAEYWATYYEHPHFNYEWNDGYLEEKPMADFINFAMYEWFWFILKHYLQANNIAAVVGLEMGFRLKLKSKTKIRKPDLGVVLHTNPVPLRLDDHTYHGIFDMCIESVSDSTQKEVERDTITKYAEYAEIGVKEYFLLYASGEEIAFYRLNETLGIYEPLDPPDGIIRSSVLPGFQFRQDDLFTQPNYDEMLDDPIYQGFIGLKYQQERLKAKQQRTQIIQERAKTAYERSRAEEERVKAEAERAKAERYGQKLKELGISLDEL